jgi:hypothetical protein
MAYLENFRVVHRDLAARNVLVFAEAPLLQVKLGDFGSEWLAMAARPPRWGAGSLPDTA